jgi:segregation and condensation protein B
MTNELKSIIESLLFVSEKPLTIDTLKGVLPHAVSADIRQALAELMAEYEARSGGFLIKQVAGGYQFRTRSAHNEWIKRLIKPATPRLSKAALETLAIIAYKQPIIRSDIEHIRGVDSGGVIRMLLDRKLIRILGRKEIPGRPLIYATTRQFLEVFDLKSLKDLPTPAEIEAYGSRQSEMAELQDKLAFETEAATPPDQSDPSADILPLKSPETPSEANGSPPASVNSMPAAGDDQDPSVS